MFEYPTASDETAGYAIVTDRFVCLLGPEAPAAVAGSLYALLEGDRAASDEALELLARESVGRFAVVEIVDAATRSFRVAVHGDVDVELRGSASTRFSAPAGAIWISSEASGVESLGLAIGAPGAAGRLPIRRGVVRATSIAVAEPSPSAARPEAHPATRPISLPMLARTGEPAGKGPALPVPGGGGLDSPVPAAEAPKRSARSGGLRPPQKRGTAASARPGWTLLLPDGSELDPSTPVVLGRRPWPAGLETTGRLHVVADSPRREISGTHLEVYLDDGELRARDLDSTNGTVVYTSRRAPRLLHEGRATSLELGDILDLGESYRVAIAARS